MSVLIKGMEMPKACEWCSFISTFTTENGLGCRCEVEKFEFWDYSKRQENCPLVEVPTPHGRLIDEEAIYNNVKSRCNNCHISACAICGVTCILNDIRTAPTIIEAEVSE